MIVAARPSKPVVVVIRIPVCAPSISESDPTTRMPSGPMPMHVVINPMIRLRISGGALAIEGTTPATAEDWGREYLDMIIAARPVDSIEAALAHIRHYGSNHTDCIITEDAEAAATFFQRLDSAILMHNASTQFADGGEFGMGAEIGIATGKMHARGPVGAAQLTSFKYLVTGNGTLRG